MVDMVRNPLYIFLLQKVSRTVPIENIETTDLLWKVGRKAEWISTVGGIHRRIADSGGLIPKNRVITHDIMGIIPI
jgi:hypothetical protein